MRRRRGWGWGRATRVHLVQGLVTDMGTRTTMGTILSPAPRHPAHSPLALLLLLLVLVLVALLGWVLVLLWGWHEGCGTP